MRGITMVLTTALWSACSVSAQTNLEIPAVGVIGRIIEICSSVTRCQAIELEPTILITESDRRWSWSWNYLGQDTQSGHYSIVAETREAAIGALDGLIAYSRQAFYPMRRLENGYLSVRGHAINTLHHQPNGFAPGFMHLSCPARLIG